MSQKIDVLARKVLTDYRFTPEVYPSLINADADSHKLFSIRHLLAHMTKANGAIASQVEAAEHGGRLDDEKISEATAKMLINTVKMAEILGISVDELSEQAVQVMKS